MLLILTPMPPAWSCRTTDTLACTGFELGGNNDMLTDSAGTAISDIRK